MDHGLMTKKKTRQQWKDIFREQAESDLQELKRVTEGSFLGDEDLNRNRRERGAISSDQEFIERAVDFYLRHAECQELVLD